MPLVQNSPTHPPTPPKHTPSPTPSDLHTNLINTPTDHTGIPPLNHNNATIHDSKEKAEIFNKYFHSVYTQEDLTNIPSIKVIQPQTSLLLTSLLRVSDSCS